MVTVKLNKQSCDGWVVVVDKGITDKGSTRGRREGARLQLKRVGEDEKRELRLRYRVAQRPTRTGHAPSRNQK